MKRKTGFIIGGGLAVIAAVVAAAALGYLYGGVETPEQRALVYYNVCGNDIIDKFNGSISSPDNLKKIAGEIEKKNHYADDATCVVALYFYHTTADANGHSQKTDDLYNKIKNLSDKGIYASGRLKVPVNVEQLNLLRSKQSVPENKQ